MKRLIFLLLFVSVLAASLLYAATVQVSWDQNTEADMASYKVYQGNTVVGTVQHPTATFDVLNVPDGIYTYYVSAVDTAGNESVKSDGASITVNTTAPAKPTGIRAIIKN